MKRLIILNPASRHGKAERLFAGQRADWEKRLGPFELYLTKRSGDATDKVRSVLQGSEADQILVAGGDGSINEAFSGYWSDDTVTRPDIPLGIINLGTGGDFFRTVTAISPDYPTALAENRFRLVDAGALSTGASGESRPFLNVASVGMAAAMLRSLKSSRFQAGAAAYFFHTLKTFLGFTPRKVMIEAVDREGASVCIETDLINLFVCNGRCSGGGMQWAPGAMLDDGLLRLTLITGTRKWPLIWHSGKLYRGQIEAFPGARTLVVREVSVTCTDALGFETDGEILESTRAAGNIGRFEVRPRVFPLLL